MHPQTQLRRFIIRIEQGWSPVCEDRQSTHDEWAVLKLNAVKNGSFVEKQHKALNEREPREEYEVRPGDLLITRANTPDLVGDACFVQECRPRLILSDLHYRLTFPQNRVDGRFIAYSLISSWGRGQAKSAARGSSQSMVKLNQEHIKSWYVPFPDIVTQKAIADYLDRKTEAIDAIIAKKQRLIELLEEKRAALINRAVTKGLNPDVPMKDSGVEWIGEIPEHWETTALRWVRQLGTSITYGIVQAGPHVDDGVPYIRVSEMSGDKLPIDGYKKTSIVIDESYARSRVFPGDLVVAIRASVGKVLMVPEGLPMANLTQGTAKVSIMEGVSNHFVFWAIQSEASQSAFWHYAKGATFKEITLEVLRKHKFVLPPADEQEEIVQYLSIETARIDLLRSRVVQQIETLQEYRQALITAAVTGQIDVTEDAR